MVPWSSGPGVLWSRGLLVRGSLVPWSSGHFLSACCFCLMLGLLCFLCLLHFLAGGWWGAAPPVCKHTARTVMAGSQKTRIMHGGLQQRPRGCQASVRTASDSGGWGGTAPPICKHNAPMVDDHAVGEGGDDDAGDGDDQHALPRATLNSKPYTL